MARILVIEKLKEEQLYFPYQILKVWDRSIAKIDLSRENEEIPFRDWKNKLDVAVRARIQARIMRTSQGNLGDYKSVGNGVFKLRFHFASGPRIYFGFDGDEVILLLVGGIKKGQSRDVSFAEALWQEYLWRKEEENNDKTK